MVIAAFIEFRFILLAFAIKEAIYDKNAAMEYDNSGAYFNRGMPGSRRESYDEFHH
jgi:hypothetical protein